jgi:hypothetical protein
MLLTALLINKNPGGSVLNGIAGAAINCFDFNGTVIFTMR